MIWLEVLLAVAVVQGELVLTVSGVHPGTLAFVFAHLCGGLSGYLWVLVQQIGELRLTVPEVVASYLESLTEPERRRKPGTASLQQQQPPPQVLPPFLRLHCLLLAVVAFVNPGTCSNRGVPSTRVFTR